MNHGVSLFYDNLGNFQWTSITAVVSFFVLIAQVIQYYVQHNRIKSLKEIDVLIEFKTSSLKEVKNSLRTWLQHTSFRSSTFNIELFMEYHFTILINLNKNNPHHDKFFELLTKFNDEYSEFLDSGKNIFKSDVVLKLTDIFNEYEKEEINQISKYK